MKKTLLLAAATLFAATSFAQTWTVVGADVNGEAWNPGATNNDMVATANAGEFELSCNTLSNQFKIVPNHDWANGLCSNGDKLTLGTAYSYTVVADGGDNIAIDIKSNEYLTNAKVVLNTTAATITVTGTIAEKEPVDPSQITYYIIGTNVNGESWTESAPDAAFTSKGNGIYEWKGEILGTGFKINDGTWTNEDINFGSNGAALDLGTPYYFAVGGSTGNIAINGATEVVNPVVVLDINEQTVTVSGEGAGESAWYIMGINGSWDFIPDNELAPVEGQDGVFTNVITVYETAGTCKVADTGWAHELGTNDPETVMINADSMEITLDDVGSGEGNINYELAEGQYQVTFDYNEYTLTFSTEIGGVEEVVLTIGGKAEYYNLHGQKVANPDKGIYIQVVNGKATKVVK